MTEHVSGIVDYISHQLLRKIPRYLKEKTNFLGNISRHIDTVALGSMLFSMELSCICIKIPHADELAACRNLLDKHNIQSDISADVPILIDFSLMRNAITFNDKYYSQTIGTAMGTQIAAGYANIFMEYVENSFFVLLAT